MQIPIGDLVAQIDSGEIRRVPGTAVFVARISRDIPPLVVWHLRHIRSLHDSIVIVNVVTEMIPYVADEDRMESARDRPAGVARPCSLRFHGAAGSPALLERAQAKGYPVDPSKATYFIGRETVVRRKDGKGLPWLVRRYGSRSCCAIRARQSSIFACRGIWLLR